MNYNKFVRTTFFSFLFIVTACSKNNSDRFSKGSSESSNQVQNDETGTDNDNPFTFPNNSDLLPNEPDQPKTNPQPTPDTNCKIQRDDNLLESTVSLEICHSACIDVITLSLKAKSVICSFEGNSFYNQIGDYISRSSRSEAESYAVEFKEKDYLLMYPDVKQAVQQRIFKSAFEHYQKWGAKEHRNPNIAFKNFLYSVHNTDVYKSNFFVNGWEHFVKHGVDENRRFCLAFDELAYMKKHKDVGIAVLINKTVPSALYHYDQWGRTEKRQISIFNDLDVTNDQILCIK